MSQHGEGKALRCPHHWTYHLDGEPVGAPEGRTIPCRDKARLSLFSARVEEFCGLILVNLYISQITTHEDEDLVDLEKELNR